MQLLRARGWLVLIAIFFVACTADPPTRPDQPAAPPHEVWPSSGGKADGFDWGSGCKGGSGTFNQAISKDAVVTVGTIPGGKVNVDIKLTSNKDVDIQLVDSDGTKIVHWPDGILNEATKKSTTYKGVKITWSGYNGDGTNLGHEYIKLEGETKNDFVMKAYGYAAGQARVEYKWAAKPDCTDSGSGSFKQAITKDAVVTVGTIPGDLSNVKIQLKSTVDIDIQLLDAAGTKVVHWPDGILNGAAKGSTTYKGVKITWSGYNGDGTGKGNEYINIEGKTQNAFVMKAFGYQAGQATVSYSWGGGGGTSTGGASVIFSPVSSTSSSHVAKVVSLIKGAKTSVDIAMYSLSDSRVNNALRDAISQRGVKVRFIFHSAQADRKSATPSTTKSGKLEAVGVDVRYASKSKVMHHKFMIVDGPVKDATGAANVAAAKTATLVTGSGNWSGGAQTNYNENTIFLSGAPRAVLQYQAEFNRLWNYSHDFVYKSFTYNQAATLDSSTFPAAAGATSLFTSANFKKNLSFTVIKGSYVVASALVKELQKAKTSIYIASGHFRSWPIYDALVKLKQQKPSLDIKVYLDGQEYVSSYYSGQQETKLQTCLTAAGSDQAAQQVCRLKGRYYGYKADQAGLAVRYKYYSYRWDYHYAKQMHNKYAIIDNETLLTGSYNYSDNAERGTMENVLVLTGSKYAAVVKKYTTSFLKMWKTDESGALLSSLNTKVKTSSTIPLVFPPMSLTWSKVTTLKALIKANCTKIDTEDYRKNPNSHKTCPRN